MIFSIHIEVILIAGYALFLIGVAATLELLARRAHRNSESYRHAGFSYRREKDVWECPTGHHLERIATDHKTRIALYRAKAHVCNGCHRKENCTDSEHGRILKSRLDAQIESELRHFHRGISLTLLLLAMLMLAAEMLRFQDLRDDLLMGALLILLAIVGGKSSVAFFKRKQTR